MGTIPSSLADVVITGEARRMAWQLRQQALRDQARERATALYRDARGALDTEQFDAVTSWDGDQRTAPAYYCPGQRTVTVDLAGTSAEIPAPAPVRSRFLADWRQLPVFRKTARVAGWCGLATRGAPR